MISVVIPAYNEEESIHTCLSSLVSQKTHIKFEVILVDNNCTDKTIEIARRFASKLNLKIVKETKKGRGAARKKGFAQASFDLIFSTDADAIVPSNWVENLHQKFDDASIAAFTGTGLINDSSKFKNTLFNFIQPTSMHFYRLFFGHYWLTGFNFGIRKNVYEASGGFDSQLTALEDVDLGFKVKKVGKICFFSDTPVLTSKRRFERGLFKGLFEYPTTFFHYFFLRDKKVILNDVR